MNKKIVHDALILTAFTLVLGFILGGVNEITKKPIAEANQKTQSIGVNVLNGFACATCVHAADNIGAGFQHQRSVFGSFATGNTLDDDL